MRFAAHQGAVTNIRVPRRLLAHSNFIPQDGAEKSFHKTTQSQTRRCRYRTPCLLPPALLCQPPDRIPHKLPPHNLTTGAAYTHTERLSQFSLGRASTPPCDSHAPIRRRRCTAPAPITRSYPLLSLSYTHPAVRTKIIVQSKHLNSAGRPTGSGRARTPTSRGRGACSSRRP